LLEEEMGIGGGGGRREMDLSREVRNVLLRETETSMVGQKILQFASRIGRDVRDAIVKAFHDDNLSSKVVQSVGVALLPGFIDLVAQHKGDASYSSSTYMLSLGRSARLDGIQNAGDYIVVIDTSSGDDGISRIRSYVPIDADLLRDVATEKDEFYSVASRGHEVRGRRVVRVGSLELSSSPIQVTSTELITDVLLETIVSLGGVNKALIQTQAKKSKHAIVELRNRVRLATKLSSNQNWPDCFAALDSVDDGSATAVEEESLLSVVEPWLSVAGSLKNVNILDILLSVLSPDQMNYLNEYFPIKIQAPDGSNIPLSYAGEIPTASAKLQQFFGSTISPFVGEPNNCEAISLTLLSPAGKPLAQTMDLPFFWKETYPLVRSEMRGR
jgi:ATP-dependent helicase HrpB